MLTQLKQRLLIAFAVAGAFLVGVLCLPKYSAATPTSQATSQASPITNATTRRALLRYQEADAVLIGRISKVMNLLTLERLPVNYTMTLLLSNMQLLKGQLPANTTFSYATAHQHKIPKKGERWLIAVRIVKQHLPKAMTQHRVIAIYRASPALIQAAKRAAKTPLHGSWNKDLLGQGIRLDIEQVRPTWQHRWINPYGDGKFRIILTNTTQKPIKTSAVWALGKRQHRRIFWKRSILLRKENKFTRLPGTSMAMEKGAKPLVLEAGESISVLVDVLPLGCDVCPGGGRMEYTFYIGEKSVTSFFYYSYKYHHPQHAKK